MADSTFGFAFESAVSHETAREEDSALVGGLKAGEDWAYEALIQRYQQPIYSLVFRLMDDPSEAADVVQEVFLKVFRSIGSFRGQSSLKTWTYRIAVNEAHNHRRWFGRHRRKEVGLAADEDTSYQDLTVDPGVTPFQAAATAETLNIIAEELGKLNEAFRAVVVLRDIQDLEYEEIAQVLEISLGTVKSRLVRGREALRKRLEERMGAAARLQFVPAAAE